MIRLYKMQWKVSCQRSFSFDEMHYTVFFKLTFRIDFRSSAFDIRSCDKGPYVILSFRNQYFIRPFELDSLIQMYDVFIHSKYWHHHLLLNLLFYYYKTTIVSERNVCELRNINYHKWSQSGHIRRKKNGKHPRT